MKKLSILIFTILLTSCSPPPPSSTGSVSSGVKRLNMDDGVVLDYYVVNIDGVDYFVSRFHNGFCMIGGKVEKKRKKE